MNTSDLPSQFQDYLRNKEHFDRYAHQDGNNQLSHKEFTQALEDFLDTKKETYRGRVSIESQQQVYQPLATAYDDWGLEREISMNDVTSDEFLNRLQPLFSDLQAVPAYEYIPEVNNSEFGGDKTSGVISELDLEAFGITELTEDRFREQGGPELKLISDGNLYKQFLRLNGSPNLDNCYLPKQMKEVIKRQYVTAVDNFTNDEALKQDLEPIRLNRV